MSANGSGRGVAVVAEPELGSGMQIRNPEIEWRPVGPVADRSLTNKRVREKDYVLDTRVVNRAEAEDGEEREGKARYLYIWSRDFNQLARTGSKRTSKRQRERGK